MKYLQRSLSLLLWSNLLRLYLCEEAKIDDKGSCNSVHDIDCKSFEVRFKTYVILMNI